MIKKFVFVTILLASMAFVTHLSYVRGCEDGYMERRAFEIEVIQPMQAKWINKIIIEAKRPIVIIRAKPKSLKT